MDLRMSRDFRQVCRQMDSFLARISLESQVVVVKCSNGLCNYIVALIVITSRFDGQDPLAG